MSVVLGCSGRLSESAVKLDHRILTSCRWYARCKFGIEASTWFLLVLGEASLIAAHLGGSPGLLGQRNVYLLYRRCDKLHGARTIESITIYIAYSYW
jgi:hypothetical protein